MVPLLFAACVSTFDIFVLLDQVMYVCTYVCACISSYMHVHPYIHMLVSVCLSLNRCVQCVNMSLGLHAE